MSVGFSDSRVKVWSLVPQKLKTMKSAEQLQDINLEAGWCLAYFSSNLLLFNWFVSLAKDGVLQRIMEDRSAETTKTLLGHTGPVYKTSFSPDRSLLLSCSEDGTSK